MLAVFEALAVEAGAAIMAIRAAGINARFKNDQSPVTEADEQAEKIILDGLPAISRTFRSSPKKRHPPETSRKILTTRFFLVDPLDGTKEFVAGREDFTVNIALIENGVPIAGIVYAPARFVLYAGAGNCAYRAGVDGHDRTPHSAGPQKQDSPRTRRRLSQPYDGGDRGLA